MLQDFRVLLWEIFYEGAVCEVRFLMFLACCLGSVKGGQAKTNRFNQIPSKTQRSLFLRFLGLDRKTVCLGIPKAPCTVVVYNLKSGLDGGTFDSPFARLCQIPKTDHCNWNYQKNDPVSKFWKVSNLSDVCFSLKSSLSSKFHSIKGEACWGWGGMTSFARSEVISTFCSWK